MTGEAEKDYDVCFISFSKPANDARTYNLVKTMANNGKNVCLIALTDNAGNHIQNEEFDLYGIEEYQHPKMWRRWKEFSKKSKSLLKKISANLFIAEDIYSLHIAYRFVKKSKAKFLYDSREIYSALGPLHNNKLKQKFITKYEKRYIKHVDEIIVSGELDAEYLREYFDHDIPYHVIMNLPYYREPVNSDIIKEKYDLKSDEIALIYQGMILPGRGIEKVIESLQFLEKTHFFILGEGRYRKDYEELSRDLNLRNRVHFCGLIPYNELHSWTCSADIGIVFIEPVSFSYELALPNKLFEYCMARIPSLVSDLPAMRPIINKDKIGELISANAKAEEIAAAIKNINKNKEIYINNCDTAARKYSYESQVRKILSMTGD